MRVLNLFCPGKSTSTIHCGDFLLNHKQTHLIVSRHLSRISKGWATQTGNFWEWKERWVEFCLNTPKIPQGTRFSIGSESQQEKKDGPGERSIHLNTTFFEFSKTLRSPFAKFPFLPPLLPELFAVSWPRHGYAQLISIRNVRDSFFFQPTRRHFQLLLLSLVS